MRKTFLLLLIGICVFLLPGFSFGYTADRATLAGSSFQDLDTIFNQGLELYNKNLYTEAAVKFRQVISMKPDVPEAHYNLGLCYFNEKKYADAIGSFKEAIRYKSDYALAYRWLGSSHYDQKNYEEAVTA